MKDGDQSGCLLALFRVLGGSKAKPDSTERPARTAPPFRRKDYLVSKAERVCYDALVRAVEESHLVFAKIRLADLVWAPKGAENYRSWFNRIQAKHIDFVLCDRETLRPLIAIELDDSSHNRPSRVSRDQLVDDVLATAGLPLLRVRAASGYDPTMLRQQIEAMLRA